MREIGRAGIFPVCLFTEVVVTTATVRGRRGWPDDGGRPGFGDRERLTLLSLETQGHDRRRWPGSLEVKSPLASLV